MSILHGKRTQSRLMAMVPSGWRSVTSPRTISEWMVTLSVVGLGATLIAASPAVVIVISPIRAMATGLLRRDLSIASSRGCSWLMPDNVRYEAEKLTAQMGHFRAGHCYLGATAMRFAPHNSSGHWRSAPRKPKVTATDKPALI
jgi:hypothetical protein